MTRVLFVTCAAAMLALAGCGQQEAAAPPAEEAAPVTPAVDTAQVTLDFATKAANIDMLEIEASKVAVAKTKNADVKALANMLITDHTKTSTELKAWAANAGVQLPAAMDDATKASVDNLSSADAAGFDDKYLDTVIDAHEDGIEAFDAYARDGADEALRSWSAGVLPTLRGHFDKAKALRETINKS